MHLHSVPPCRKKGYRSFIGLKEVAGVAGTPRARVKGYAETRSAARREKLSTIERKITKPSDDPSASSTARSGCGISPTTFRSWLQIPAMAASEPFGFASESLVAKRSPRLGPLTPAANPPIAG